MSGNTFGLLFSVTSFGESHGPAMGCVVDGCPPHLHLNQIDIQTELNRRKPGRNPHVSQRKELDTVEILSGIFEGKTTGTPIALLIRNQDARSQDYDEIVNTFRPGHADYTYWKKYGIRDYRGGGRASARETVVRVAAGAIAKKWLREKLCLNIQGYLAQLGEIHIPFKSWQAIEKNPFFSPNEEIVVQIEDYLERIRAERDSVGARVSVIAQNVPVGLGEPVYDRLDADIAHAMMGINAVKGVEIGSGFESAFQRGAEHHDELGPEGFFTNHAGGMLGGISSGQDIVVHLTFKPTPSIARISQSIDLSGNPMHVTTKGRHDPCVGIRAVPVAEAMLALVLMDHALRLRAQCGHIPGCTG